MNHGCQYFPANRKSTRQQTSTPRLPPSAEGEGVGRTNATDFILAVRVGFEPTEPVKVQRFSRPPDSTTLAPHRIPNVPDFSCFRKRGTTPLSYPFSTASLLCHQSRAGNPSAPMIDRQGTLNSEELGDTRSATTTIYEDQQISSKQTESGGTVLASRSWVACRRHRKGVSG